MPATSRMAATASGSRSWFFGENASIDGGTIQTRAVSRPSQTNAFREKTYASASDHVGVEEFPGLVRELPRPVHPDVAAPDRADVLVLEVREEPRRLRIVDVYDVPWPNELEQLAGGLGQRVIVDPALLGPQAPSVSGGLVQVVVEALREAEELGVPGDGQPAHIDAGAAGIGEQRLEQLGDSASLRRRVDVPDHPAAEDLPGGGDRIFDLLVSIAEQRPEALRRHCGDGYLLQCVHQARPYYRALGRI